MDYNTNRDKLKLPEYGRNVQEMVDIIKNTPDREERNRLAKSTIQLMGNMNPQLRDVADFTEVSELYQERFPGKPYVIVHAPVCRPG